MVFTVAKMIAIVMLIVTGLVRLGEGEENFCYHAHQAQKRGGPLVSPVARASLKLACKQALGDLYKTIP